MKSEKNKKNKESNCHFITSEENEESFLVLINV